MKKRGRPKKAGAKRNTTTRQGRLTGFDPVDTGTDELKAKRLQATGYATLSHEDPLATLYGRHLLTTAEYNAGRDIAELIAVITPLHIGNVWQRLLTGTAAGPIEYEPSPAAERAWALLARLALIIGDSAPLVFTICSGQWLGSYLPYGAIAAGLDRVSRRWSSNRELAA